MKEFFKSSSQTQPKSKWTTRLLMAFFGLNVTVGASVVEAQTLLSVPVTIQADASQTIFPISWRGGSVNASATALDPSRWDRSSRLIAEAASKYPAAVLRDNLKNVYVLGTLSFAGVYAGGTNSASSVYVTFGSVQSALRDLQAVPIFHAEFSSILLRKLPNALDTAAWSACNEPGFSYSSNGVQAIKDGKSSTVSDARLFKQGFLKQYSQSALEEDFNAFAILLFSGDAVLWDTALKEPRLLCKLKLAEAFYNKVDPSFTRSYFLGMVSPN